MQIIIAERLTGSEDIPEGVAAVVTGAATDVLSHIAIRARAQARGRAVQNRWAQAKTFMQCSSTAPLCLFLYGLLLGVVFLR